MTISQFSSAEPELADDGSLFYIVNVSETKKSGCQVALTARRKKQVDKYLTDIRPQLIGDELDYYVFGDVGGKSMVSST